MVEQSVNQKDVRHVSLAMGADDIAAYSTTGWEYQGKILKQPPGIDIIWYGPSSPNTRIVSATFFASPLNPDPLCRKTGEDIDNELSYLPVISDKADPEGKVTHPYIKVDTILNNPQLDYNKGELDFLRSKPVKGRTEWKPKSEIDRLNVEFTRYQRNAFPDNPAKLLNIDESKAQVNPFTGEKWYPFTVAQVTTGGDKEHHGAQDPTKDGATDTSQAVPEHEQEVSNGFETVRREFDGSKPHLQKDVRMGSRPQKEILRV